MNQRLTACISLHLKQKKKSFPHKIVTRVEKWIYYDNPVNHKQWLDPDQPTLFTPKREIHVKKVMLCVWWDQKGIIYYELLKRAWCFFKFGAPFDEHYN
jgi:[histone H3]-lysine36 N-dimethyltransferase SETMAR